jgi:hypothetical protein
MATSDQMAEVRQILTSLKLALKEQLANLPVVKASAEKRVIDAAGGDEKALGSNEAARNRAFTIALNDDVDYQATLGNIRAIEAEIASHEDALEALRDKRRDEEWAIRNRLAAALDGRQITSDEPRLDSEFDDAATDAAVVAITDPLMQHPDDLFDGILDDVDEGFFSGDPLSEAG